MTDVFCYHVLGAENIIEAQHKGRTIARLMVDDILKVLDEAVERWRSEHTTLVKDTPWNDCYIEVLKEQARETLAAYLRRP